MCPARFAAEQQVQELKRKKGGGIQTPKEANVEEKEQEQNGEECQLQVRTKINKREPSQQVFTNKFKSAIQENTLTDFLIQKLIEQHSLNQELIRMNVLESFHTSLPYINQTQNGNHDIKSQILLCLMLFTCSHLPIAKIFENGIAAY